MPRTTLTIALSCGALLAGAFHSQAQQLTLLGDTYTDVSHAAHGSLPNINIGATQQAQGLLQFDLTTLPAGTTASDVTKAVLFLYVNTLNAAGNIQALEATSPWAEATATVPPGGNVVNAANVSSTGFVTIDVTQAVTDWLNGTKNYGFLINSGPALDADIAIDSKESTTTSHAPTLMVSLQGRGPLGPTGAQGPIGIAGLQGPQGTAGPTGGGVYSVVGQAVNLLSKPHYFAGYIGFAGGTTSVISLGSGAFTGTTTYFCTVRDATATGETFFVTKNSASQFTITASASSSDTVNFICAGN